jgi:hypothetical protein
MPARDGAHSESGGGGARSLDRNNRSRLYAGREWEPNMTASSSHTLRKAGLVFAFALSVSTLNTTASFAYTAEAQQMCTGDAFRLCSSEIPNVPKITACMIKHRADLSPGCRAVMDKDGARGGGKVASD